MTVDPATSYCRAVIRGQIKTNRLVKLACERHLRDIKQQKQLKIHFDNDAAQHAIEFIENFLVLAEGDHADRPFLLKPWQRFIVASIFGWKLSDDSRRFRIAYIEVAKGNGKTPLGAAMGLYCLLADGEQAAEVYSAAATKGQAEICFRDAKIMAEKSPELSQMLDIGEHNIAHHGSYSYFRPVSAEGRTLDGKRVHFALIDEIHVHRSPVVVQKMIAGMKGRRQPIVCMITNSGWDKNTVCGENHDYGVDILNQVVRDESRFVFICGLDPCAKHQAEGASEPDEGCSKCDDWLDEKVWIKANPNLGVSIPLRHIRDQVRTAKGIPSEQSQVKRFNFCIWTQNVNHWLDIRSWMKCGRQVDMMTLRDRPCYVGLDLADKIDFAAMVLLFPPKNVELFKETKEAEVEIAPDGTKRPRQVDRIDIAKLTDDYIAIPYFWMARERVEELARQDGLPYGQWVKDGYIDANDGEVIDHGFIQQKILALNEIYRFKVLGYDPAHARNWAINMVNEYRLPMLEISQTNATMSEPAKEIQRLVIAGRIGHNNNPLMNAMVRHAVTKEDAKRRIHIEKPKATKKIDGVIALVIALEAYFMNPNAVNIYNVRAAAGEESIVRRV